MIYSKNTFKITEIKFNARTVIFTCEAYTSMPGLFLGLTPQILERKPYGSKPYIWASKHF